MNGPAVETARILPVDQPGVARTFVRRRSARIMGTVDTVALKSTVFPACIPSTNLPGVSSYATSIGVCCPHPRQPAFGGFAYSADSPAHRTKVLFVTQSGGFRHGTVTRPRDTLAPAEIAMTQLGQQTGLFDVHCTQDCAADFTRENLKNYDIVDVLYDHRQ